MKGYLILATFNRLCKTLDIKKNPNQDEFLKNVYDNRHVYNILNKIEIKELFNFKNLLEFHALGHSTDQDDRRSGSKFGRRRSQSQFELSSPSQTRFSITTSVEGA